MSSYAVKMISERPYPLAVKVGIASGKIGDSSGLN